MIIYGFSVQIMASFFSLGNIGNPQAEDSTHDNNPNSSQAGLLVYRNEEIYQKGFEIWQQYVQVHHPPFVHLQYQPSSSAGVAGPSSAAAAMSSGSRLTMKGIGGGGINCQDCGNQAKKDCSHMRCRTCCKSRGFDCSTHVRSTWVPAAKRRERHEQHLLALHHQQQQPQQIQHLETGMMREKRQREKTFASDTNPSGIVASTSGLEVGQHFPSEMSTAAVFRCVRVQSVEGREEQVAYQTALNIGGHVFKGILYDQGPDEAEPSSSNPGTTSADPNTIYPPAVTAFLAGTQFFPPPRS